MAQLRVSYFAGADAWALYAGVEQGFFAAAGLDVAMTPTHGSVAQISHLMSGDFDVALTAMDNLVAYNEGQGDPSVAGPFDLVAFIGVNQGLMQLVTRPEITSYEEIRGKRLAVDAVATGFSFVLRHMLEQHGIKDGDYTYVPVGNTERRLEALAEGRADVALVQSPFDLIGKTKYGLRVLESAIDVLGHYQATVGITRRSWAATHANELTALAGAFQKATAWIHANRSAATGILARHANMPLEFAEQAAPLILDPVTGLRRDGSFEIAGIDAVLTLRSHFAQPQKALGPSASYIDERYLR
jgi:ABC-type nitrate/sulfonate/bicarbonate transport system substrate-binding protein